MARRAGNPHANGRYFAEASWHQRGHQRREKSRHNRAPLSTALRSKRRFSRSLCRIRKPQGIGSNPIAGSKHEHEMAPIDLRSPPTATSL